MTVRTTSTSGAPTARCTSSTWPPGRTKSRCLRRPSRAGSATRPSITISPRSTSGPPTATSTPSRRRSRGGPMRVARSVLYGLVGTLLLFSLVGAVQRRVFGQAPDVGEGRLRQASRVGRPVARVVAAPSDEDDASAPADEDDVAIDPADIDSGQRAAKRGPATRQNGGSAPDQIEAGSSRTSAGDPAVSAPPDRARSNPLSTLAGLFSSPVGGAASVLAPHPPSAPPVSAPRASTPPASPQPNRPQVREVFFGGREETVCQPGGREFVLENLRDLQVCIVWAGLSGTYWTQPEFQSPDGHVDQAMQQAFVTPAATATVGTVEVQGRPYQVGRAGWARPGEAVVVATLPVAGTYITQYNLAGEWMVKISLNGRPIDQGYFTLYAQQ